MGILINRYGLGVHNKLEDFFSVTIISLGSLNIIIDYLKKPKKHNVR